VRQADWQTPSDVNRKFRAASFVANDRVVFNIRGNRYRLIVVVVYQHHRPTFSFSATNWKRPEP